MLEVQQVLAVVGFHVYSSLQQILTVKDLSKESAAMSDTDGYYSGYKVEVWEGDVLLAQQRVHDFIAKSGTFIFKGALAATGAKGKIGSGAEIRVFPDQLLPQLRDSITPSQVRQGKVMAESG